MKRYTVAYLTAPLVLSAACNTAGCLDNQSAVPLAEFRSSTSKEAISISVLEISGVDAPHDSVLVEPGQSISSVYLPMRSTKESTSWCFHYAQEGIDSPLLNDTVTFRYTAEPYFASEECGAMYYYRIREVSNTIHLLDSVVILDSLITNVDSTRILMYFRTVDEPEPEPDDNEDSSEE